MKKFYQTPFVERIPLIEASAILSGSNDVLGELKYNPVYEEDFDELF